jgi:hypothetical protein
MTFSRLGVRTHFSITFFILAVAVLGTAQGCSNSGPSLASLEAQTAAQSLHNQLTVSASELNQDSAYTLTQDDLDALAVEQAADATDQAKLKLFVKN